MNEKEKINKFIDSVIKEEFQKYGKIMRWFIRKLLEIQINYDGDLKYRVSQMEDKWLI